MRASVEVKGAASLTVGGRVFAKGIKQIISDEQEINRLRRNGRLSVTLLKDEPPAKAKVVAKVAPVPPPKGGKPAPTPPASTTPETTDGEGDGEEGDGEPAAEDSAEGTDTPAEPAKTAPAAAQVKGKPGKPGKK